MSNELDLWRARKTPFTSSDEAIASMRYSGLGDETIVSMLLEAHALSEIAIRKKLAKLPRWGEAL